MIRYLDQRGQHSRRPLCLPHPSRVGRVLGTAPGGGRGGGEAADTLPTAGTMAGPRPPAPGGLKRPVLSCSNHAVRRRRPCWPGHSSTPWATLHLSATTPDGVAGKPLREQARFRCSPFQGSPLLERPPQSLRADRSRDERRGPPGSQPANRSGVAGAEQQAWGAETNPHLAPPDPAARPICCCPGPAAAAAASAKRGSERLAG